jgi:hypothetical protein
MPHWCKIVGWVMMVPLAAYFVWIFSSDLYWTWDDAMQKYIPSEPISEAWSDFLVGKALFLILTAWAIVGLLMIAFSREKVEDEYIMKLRVDSFIWGTVASFVVYMAFSVSEMLGGMGGGCIPYAVYFGLVLYILRFNVVLYLMRHEKQA